MEAAIVGFIGVLIGGLLAFIASLFKTLGSSKDVQLDVRTKIVTNERAQWRKDMRELTAAYVALSSRVAVEARDDDEYNLERTRVLIRLRLNPSPEHQLDAKLILALPSIAKSARTKHIAELTLELENFEVNMQTLLKREWDKSKGEAGTGNIAAPDVHVT